MLIFFHVWRDQAAAAAAVFFSCEQHVRACLRALIVRYSREVQGKIRKTQAAIKQAKRKDYYKVLYTHCCVLRATEGPKLNLPAPPVT